MFSKRIAVLAGTLALAGCGVGMEGGQAALTGSAQAALVTSASSQLRTTDAHRARVAPAWKSNFVITSTPDVFFALDIPSALKGHHIETVFVSYGGSPYVRYDVSFAAGVAPAAGEQAAERTATGYRVWAAMPVAGTEIEQYGLSGPWSAGLMLDSTSSSIVANFNLQ